MLLSRADGHFEATWMASFKSLALIRKNPPNCSFVSANAPSVMATLLPRNPHSRRVPHALDRLCGNHIAVPLQLVYIRRGLVPEDFLIAPGQCVQFVLLLVGKAEILHCSPLLICL